MSRSLQPRNPTGDFDFDQTFINVLAQRHPELVERLKAHRVSREDSVLLTKLTEESSQMKLAVCLHLAKYAPENSAPRKYADRHLEYFIEKCFADQHPKRDQLMDGMLAFMFDKPRLHKYYFDLVRSWEITDSTLAHIFKNGQAQGNGGGDSGKSGGNRGGGGPEGGPPGFDPL